MGGELFGGTAYVPESAFARIACNSRAALEQSWRMPGYLQCIWSEKWTRIATELLGFFRCIQMQQWMTHNNPRCTARLGDQLESILWDIMFHSGAWRWNVMSTCKS